jgi:hypothetical protein
LILLDFTGRSADRLVRNKVLTICKTSSISFFLSKQIIRHQ